MLKAMYSFRKRNKKGFTLIELLIVVAIIAILAAIAIPQFSAYRKKGYNASANSDLRNIRTSEEAMMADFQDYGASTTTDSAAGNVTGAANSSAGAAFWLVGAMSSSKPNVAVAASPSVWAYVTTNGTVDTTKSNAFDAITAHNNGDQYYGACSGSSGLVRKGFTASSTVPSTTINSYTPAAATGALADFTGGNWVSVQ